MDAHPVDLRAAPAGGGSNGGAPAGGAPAGGRSVGALAWPVAAVAAAVAVCYAANQAGWWWVTPLAGIAAALRWRGRTLAAFGVLVPLLAWGGDLLLQWTGADVTEVAKVTTALAGLGNDAAWLGYLATLAYAVLLCAVPAWLVASTRRSVRALRADRPAAGTAEPAGTASPAQDDSRPAADAEPAAAATEPSQEEVDSSV
jgi:hypothetical protein